MGMSFRSCFHAAITFDCWIKFYSLHFAGKENSEDEKDRKKTQTPKLRVQHH